MHAVNELGNGLLAWSGVASARVFPPPNHVSRCSYISWSRFQKGSPCCGGPGMLEELAAVVLEQVLEGVTLLR